MSSALGTGISIILWKMHALDRVTPARPEADLTNDTGSGWSSKACRLATTMLHHTLPVPPSGTKPVCQTELLTLTMGSGAYRGNAWQLTSRFSHNLRVAERQRTAAGLLCSGASAACQPLLDTKMFTDCQPVTCWCHRRMQSAILLSDISPQLHSTVTAQTRHPRG